MIVKLNESERSELFLQASDSAGQGGFQSLMVKLQDKFNDKTMTLLLTKQDLERIPRYAFNYSKGGWESRLRRIFARVLGPDLQGKG